MKSSGRIIGVIFSLSLGAFAQTTHLDSLIDAVSATCGKIRTYAADAEVHKFVCS